MKKFFKQLLCRHKELNYMYSENLSTEEITTTAEVDLYKCKRCEKLVLKYDYKNQSPIEQERK